jgi:uncharacterized phage-associated protein
MSLPMPVEFQFDFDKSKAAFVYLASKEVPALDTYKVCKLLFLADKYHLVKYGRPITGDKYCALPYGPIPSTILDIVEKVVAGDVLDPQAASLAEALELDRQYQHPRFKAKAAFDAIHLSQSDVMALDHVIAGFGAMGFAELKAITHEMAAYKKAWRGKPEGRNAVDMSFEEFFEEDSDAVAGAKEEMLEDDLLRKFFSAR